MLSTFFWEFVLILSLTLVSGFFSAAEIALISARRGRLQQMAEQGDRKAALALKLASDPNQFLPIVQIAITLIGTFAAAFAGANLEAALAEKFSQSGIGLIVAHAHALALGAIWLMTGFLQLLLAELVPKNLALRRAESLARLVAPAMNVLMRIGKPANWLMGKATDAVLILMQAGGHHEPAISVHDIEHLIDTGTAEGLLQPVEQKLAMEALRLGDRTVRDIMRPRIDLDALDVETPPDEVLGAVAMAGFSRLPVYERDLDHIIGFVHIKDLFRQQYLGWPMDLRKMLHPPLFVPQTVHLDRLLEMFQAKHTQLAVVLDEYGGTQGMVTLEDVIEELVGEINDEHQRDKQQEIVRRDANSWLIDGQVNVPDLLEALDMQDPEPDANRSFSTVSGLVLDQLGRIPDVGDRTQWFDLHLEVVDMDGQRIDRLMVTRTDLNAKPSGGG